MKLKFDSNQSFQLDAIKSVVNLFEGQNMQQDSFSIQLHTTDTGMFQNELGYANALDKEEFEENLLSNIQAIQTENWLDKSSKLIKKPLIGEGNGYVCPNISVEMETGTGKTYVYLRTILELANKYGLKKYIIVVPSVAIREGVLKTLEITYDHFRSLFNNIEFEFFNYDSSKPGKIKSFATANTIQIMVINIDAFRKDFTDSENQGRSNVIFKESDKLSGRKPIEFIQATKPIVIIDEPQSVDNTEKAQSAINQLSPLIIFRYSATHINPYNLVYKLDPIRAFELGIVKQIVVASVIGEDTNNDAYVKLLQIDNKSGLKAKIEILYHQDNGSLKKKTFTVKNGTDLYSVSNQNNLYKEGYEITEINIGEGFIKFSLKGDLKIGDERGGIKSDVTEEQINRTIRKHLDKELSVKDKGIKVLTLFFIDKVANYREYDTDSNPIKGKYASLFESLYTSIIKEDKYKSLGNFGVEKIHDGYFSTDNKGKVKDTKGDSKDDIDTYAKIMKNKEQLLSLDEPLKFIFSHSALREGWDNPNVFQICTLNETVSILKKRQEIGRGLRLPVNQDGERIFDKNINKLTIIANESYDDFAKKLQTEYEDECGVTFGKVTNTIFNQLIDPTNGERIETGLANRVYDHLIHVGIIDSKGIITDKFNPIEEDFSLNLFEEVKNYEIPIIELLEKYTKEKHIKRDEQPKKLIFKKQVALDENFQTLWNKISQRTTYQVNFDTQELIDSCVKAIRKMDDIRAVKIIYKEGYVDIQLKGLIAKETLVTSVAVDYHGPLPDIISYIQRATELTRHTIVQILKKSNKLDQFIVNPQKFMDAVVAVIKNELNKVIIDGITYQKIDNEYYSMKELESEELNSYLHNRFEVNKSIYDAIIFDSSIERKFAESLESNETIKLFVKLPSWFKIDTPVGSYNPDWAIVKEDKTKVYFVCETKGNIDFYKLRNIEADKIKCGKAHFKEINVPFEVVSDVSQIDN